MNRMASGNDETWRDILMVCCPDLVVRGYRYTQQGWDSVTLLVNDEMIVRIARRPDVAERLGREARLLPALAKHVPLAIPHFTRVCADPAVTGGARLVAYPAIDGISLAEKGVPAGHEDASATQLALFLTVLHRFPVSVAVQLGATGGSANEWRQEYRAFYEEIRQHVFPLLSMDERAYTVALWEGFLGDDACFAFEPRLIHRDLVPDHIFRNRDSGQLTGIIDWGDASIGDPAIDFSGLYCDISPAFSESILEQYGLPMESSFWRRVRFYASISPFYEIRFGQNEGYATHIGHGLEALRDRIRQV